MINAAKAMIPTTIPTARTIAHACSFLFSVAVVISEDKPVKTYYMFINKDTNFSIQKIREQSGTVCGCL